MLFAHGKHMEALTLTWENGGISETQMLIFSSTSATNGFISSFTSRSFHLLGIFISTRNLKIWAV